MYTIPHQIGYYVPQPLLHQLWSTGLNEKWFNGSTSWDRSHGRSTIELCPDAVNTWIDLSIKRKSLLTVVSEGEGSVLIRFSTRRLMHYIQSKKTRHYLSLF